MTRLVTLILLLQAALILDLKAHPVPDIPVRAYFDGQGTMEIRIEVDPRSYEADPEAFEYYLKSDIEKMDPTAVEAMKSKVKTLLDQRLRLHFEPEGAKIPELKWEFRKIGDEPWEAPTDETSLVGVAKFKLTDEISYRVESLKLTEKSLGIPMNVVFKNFFNGVQAERYAVLFPGETSFALDLKNTVAGVSPK